jgi:hypothetical protein
MRSSRPPSRRRALLLGATTVALASALGLAAGEAALRGLRRRVEGSDRLDRGLTAYDPELGWALTPNWTGRHRHHDYDVGYATNTLAFRGAIEAAREPCALWLGDSFTFGFGVEQGATFVDLLDASRAGGLRHVNLGAPGYSTDQEVLLLERRLPEFDARFVGLVAYLSNDLIDNGLAFPLQAATAKPYFELRDGRLQRRNAPVPLAAKPAFERTRGLGARLFEMAGIAPSRFDRLANLLETPRWLGLERPPAPPDFGRRAAAELEASLELFRALVGRASGSGRPLALVLLASRRHLAAPASWAARYQEALRRELLRRPPPVPLLDLADGLRRASGSSGFHHPNDGHLTEAGHAAVAERIAAARLL